MNKEIQKNDVTKKYEEGLCLFDEYLEKNQIKEWFNEYMTFLDDGTLGILVDHYTKLYNSKQIENGITNS
jgi:hypothetical protein